MAHCNLQGGKSRKKRTRGLRTRRHVKSNRRNKKKQRGGQCGACVGGQKGGSGLLNAIVPASILLALSRFTKTNRRRTKKQRKSRRRR